MKVYSILEDDLSLSYSKLKGLYVAYGVFVKSLSDLSGYSHSYIKKELPKYKLKTPGEIKQKGSLGTVSYTVQEWTV